MKIKPMPVSSIVTVVVVVVVVIIINPCHAVLKEINGLPMHYSTGTNTTMKERREQEKV